MKYRFVKRRKEVSTEEINSMKDFDSVLKGSRRILDVAYKGKLLWTLTIPVAIVVYTLVVGQSTTDEVSPVENLSAPKEEVVNMPPKEKAKKEEASTTEVVKKDEPKPVKKAINPPVQASKPAATEELEQPAAEIESSKELIKEDVSTKAEPQLGFEDFYAFIDKELTYPELARKDSVQGHVKVLFAVKSDGSIGDVKVLESLGDLFDNEAIRVIKRSPLWNPATFNGEAVRSRMSIKLTFRIQ